MDSLYRSIAAVLDALCRAFSDPHPAMFYGLIVDKHHYGDQSQPPRPA
jgi:hypothetical protein